ncbi:stemmadenine O-acetyltransferase-like [Syzygium oleosum]|uniref:stemmadenine O-acetyltransferase-like n=1 Tax=Syzygium oleosum TaxID=219896 RepID=UPI0011D2326F|nr:stemmadenine O-acetyltransferase-like [Syzygium oleosum]
MKGNAAIDCNDDGALYLEAKAHFELSQVLSNPDINQLQQFLPFSPYTISPNIEEQVIVGVQATFFDCGSIGIGSSNLKTPFLKASELFQPKDINFQMPSGVISREKLLTKRFRFDGESLARLRAMFGSATPTRIEAVTALIWKSAMEAARKRPDWNKTCPPSSAVTRVHCGTLVEPNEKVELQDFAGILRKSIRAIDSEYLSALQGKNGLAKACKSLMAARKLAAASAGEIELYRFSSWARFPFYEVDFGWGRPGWVCTTSVPMKNVVILMGTRCGDGIEAWITLAEHDMIEFERDDEFLQFITPSP